MNQCRRSEKSIVHRVGYTVAVNTIHEICEKNMDLGRRLFLQEPMLQYLAKVVVDTECTGDHEDDNDRVMSSVRLDNADVSDPVEVLSGRQLHDAMMLYLDVRFIFFIFRLHLD